MLYNNVIFIMACVVIKLKDLPDQRFGIKMYLK